MKEYLNPTVTKPEKLPIPPRDSRVPTVAFEYFGDDDSTMVLWRVSYFVASGDKTERSAEYFTQEAKAVECSKRRIRWGNGNVTVTKFLKCNHGGDTIKTYDKHFAESIEMRTK